NRMQRYSQPHYRERTGRVRPRLGIVNFWKRPSASRPTFVNEWREYFFGLTQAANVGRRKVHGRLSMPGRDLSRQLRKGGGNADRERDRGTRRANMKDCTARRKGGDAQASLGLEPRIRRRGADAAACVTSFSLGRTLFRILRRTFAGSHPNG